MNNLIFTSKRKSCVCRLYELKIKESKIKTKKESKISDNLVNNKKLEVFFSDIPFYVTKIYNVLKLFDLETEFKFSCNVKGGGKTGQADSIRYALAKLLKSNFLNFYKEDKDKFNAANTLLRKNGLLTVDTRKVEPKHYGRLKSRCKRQRSKR